MTTDSLDEKEPKGRRATAEAMAKGQRDISVSEFFTKNRHLLGFDNPQKALLTAVKEAVDNSLDACEEAGILPTLRVQIEETAEGRFRVTVEDNGPGIVKAQIPKIFAKLLYGSKFHRLKQSRGQQGIGISAAGMYGQLTTGRPIIIISKTGKGRKANRLEVRIDARANAPEVLKEEEIAWESDHGTIVAIEMTGLYRGGRASVATYLEQTVVANPHLELKFEPPKGDPTFYPRASEALPPETQEIKPHPYGVELGMLIKSFQQAGERTAREVLMEDYSRVTKQVADQLLSKSNVDPGTRAARMDGPHIEDVHRVIQVSQAVLPPLGRLFKTFQKRDDKFVPAVMELGANFTPSLIETLAQKAAIAHGTLARQVEMSQLEKFQHALEKLQVRILPPPSTCVAPIGEALIVEGLKRRFKADFYASHTRPPAVYRGNPFVVEVGVAYGGELPKDQSAELLRFANRVPLLYQPRACATSEAVVSVNWKSYGKDGGVNQRGSELPVGPLAILVHLASVWVPFTNEAKEAIASYDEIVDEIRAALQECGRKLGTWVNAQQAHLWQLERKSLFERYIEEISTAIGSITGLAQAKVKSHFHEALPRHVKLDAPPTLPPPPSGDDGGSTPPSTAGASEAPPSAPPSDRPLALVMEEDDDGEGAPRRKGIGSSGRAAERSAKTKVAIEAPAARPTIVPPRGSKRVKEVSAAQLPLPVVQRALSPALPKASAGAKKKAVTEPPARKKPSAPPAKKPMARAAAKPVAPARKPAKSAAPAKKAAKPVAKSVRGAKSSAKPKRR